MRGDDERHDVWLVLVALAPAAIVSWQWRATPLVHLPLVVTPLFAAWQMARCGGLDGAAAFLGAVALTGPLSVVAWLAGPLSAPWIYLAGWLLLAWAVRRRPVAKVAGMAAALLLLIGLQTALLPPRPTRREATAAARPLMFIPLEVDPTGRRVMLFSLRDDELDDDRMAIWTLDLHSGALARAYLGHPFLSCDWAPDGQAFVTTASGASRDEQTQPLGLAVAAAAGGGSRWLVNPPNDGTCWLLPLWSKKGNLVGAWLLPETPELPLSAEGLPRSYVVPAGGGEPKELSLRGSRLSLFSAWQADDTGAFMTSEHGIYLLSQDGRQRRIVAAGEAPLDPFPLAIPEGVSPSGKHLAYLELTFKGGDIARMDLCLTDLRGRRRSGVPDLYPMAMSWSRDGRWLAGAQVGKRGDIVVQLLDVGENRRRTMKTGLKLASRELPMRLLISPDRRWAALDGQFSDAESWDIALLDLQTGQVRRLDEARNQLVVGWRNDGRLAVGDLGSISLVDPNGGGLEPVYPRELSAEWSPLLVELAARRVAAWRQVVARLPDWLALCR